MAEAQLLPIEGIKDLLLAQVGQVAYRYAPPGGKSYEDKGRYFTLNPGRPDKSVGSFYIHLDGSKAGRWTDHATGDHGDILDLIALSLGCNLTDAIREARSFLGLQALNPADLARRKAAAERAKAHRLEAARQERRARENRARSAHRLWLSAEAQIRGTPVEFYLRDRRGIDLARLGRQPGAIRFARACFYRHIDAETGEITEGAFPAMVALVNDRMGKAVACHRTYLAIGADGRWDKAPLPAAKKVLGDYAGAWINIWTGTGPRGGKAGSLSTCPPGTHVYVTEGIEDALSGVMLLPEARWIAGISLSNLGGLALPGRVASVTIAADLDPGPAQQAALQRAIAQLRGPGRRVRLWQNGEGGKDLNDALRARSEQGRADHDAA